MTNVMRTGMFLAVALAVLSCGKPKEESLQKPAQAAEKSTSPAPKTRVFGVVYQTMNNPFFVELNEGLKQVIEARGDQLIALDCQFNSLKQKNDISDLLLKGVSGLFINPVNWEGIKGSLLQAKQKGVPCVVVDAPVKDEDLVVCQVASDNLEAGRLAGQALVQARRPAKIAILQLATNKACIDRVQGFQEEIAKYPDMQLVDTQEGGGTAEKARPVMRDVLGRFPDLNAVFPINDPSAMGVISALESADKLKDVTVVTVDGSAEGIAAIEAGKLHSTSAQFPREIGKTAAEKLYDHLEGKPVDRNIKIRVELITQENAASFAKK